MSKTTDFSKVLMVHCHTTGLNFNSDDITKGHQPLSIGLGVVDMNTMKMVDSYYSKIRLDTDLYKWDEKLESIHGLDFHDISDPTILRIDDVQGEIALFLDKNFGIENRIPLMGYNIASFHYPFLKRILDYNEPFEFSFEGRMIDLFTVMALFGKYTIHDTLEFFNVDQSEPLSSLQLVKNYLKIYKTFTEMLSL